MKKCKRCCLWALPLALLLTGGEITGQACEPAASVSPDAAKLKEDGSAGRTLRIRQHTFELIEALLRAEHGSILLAQLIHHPLALSLQFGKFALEFGPIPEQPEQPVVFNRLATGKQLLGQG